ncbi:MAG: type III-B CRISPR module RAMP protein Cmr4 [Firmicutes bacterium]|jgi:CRISPR-associated protein Cmr4|nr:type III-B CRISPR module RAMP protein Cmr4 [Bacillota bacterium]
MYTSKGMLFLYGQSWLHPGAGASTGAIDLPIQREVHTDYPVIPASSVKGSLRETAERRASQGVVDGLFGPEVQRSGQDKAEYFAGALTIGDAKLLLFPVRSLTRSFFWTTSPLALARFWRDLKMIGIEPGWDAPLKVDAECVMVPHECEIRSRLFLEEMDFKPQKDMMITEIAKFIADRFDAAVIGGAFIEKLKRDLAVLSDDEFGYFIRYATQVSARIQLTSRKTTDRIIGPDGQEEQGNLWYEESLPPETVFYVPLFADAARGGALKTELSTGGAVMDKLDHEVLARRFIQLGGNETLGHGWCATFLVRGDA